MTLPKHSIKSASLSVKQLTKKQQGKNMSSFNVATVCMMNEVRQHNLQPVV